MHDIVTKMTFQTPPHNSMYAVPPSLLRKTFQPVDYDHDMGFNPEMLDKFVDDDEFSDHDSHYSEDFTDDFRYQLTESGPNMTKQLLDFADIVNTDIKKFFGAKKGVDDSCDIYADKWKPIKSGRERYYRDLLRIAEGDNDLGKNGKDDIQDMDNRHKFTGRFDKRIGLGPLKELFEHGLHTEPNRKTKLKDPVKEKYKYGKVPMHQRRFPESFWKQPTIINKRYYAVNQINTITNSPKPPDFSDLLETWTMIGDSEFSGGDLSSDTSTTSPESVNHRRI